MRRVLLCVCARACACCVCVCACLSGRGGCVGPCAGTGASAALASPPGTRSQAPARGAPGQSARARASRGARRAACPARRRTRGQGRKRGWFWPQVQAPSWRVRQDGVPGPRRCGRGSRCRCWGVNKGYRTVGTGWRSTSGCERHFIVRPGLRRTPRPLRSRARAGLGAIGASRASGRRKTPRAPRGTRSAQIRPPAFVSHPR